MPEPLIVAQDALQSGSEPTAELTLSRRSYYERVLAEAWSETRRFTVARLALVAAIVVLTSIFTWVFTDEDALTGFLVGVATLFAVMIGTFCWACITIPANLALEAGRELQVARHIADLARRDMDFHQQRIALRNVLASFANECSINAKSARLEEIRASTDGTTIDPEPIYAAALNIALRTQKEVRRLVGYESQAEQIGRTVDGAPPADAKEAIARLDELQRTIESQLRAGFY